ncbi:MAG: formate dehydrogenase subunit gamma [Rhodospirillales bacterium]|nr:formate dehydrogenase subunit gamma [Rhodospirillales bacterium]
MTRRPRRFALVVLLMLLGLASGTTGLVFTTAFDTPAYAQTEGRVPGNALGGISDAEMWRDVRQGVKGTVSIPDKKLGTLVQSEGDNWRAWRNGPILVVGAIAFWVMFFVVFGFYMIRGKVRIKRGKSGRKVLRFGFIERFGHWLTAGSFLVLAATGVNMLYGKFVLIPLLGPQAFSTITQYGKYIHNYVAFAFMAGLVLIFVLWVKDNIWDQYDWGWIKKGGGLLFPTAHPAAAKFNFGQKTVFWAVMVFGGLLSVTGINLLFPFMFADLEQMQWIQAIHATISQIICMMMIAHIYIGTVGMEDAFHAMSSGYVDENWAKEHHSAWYDKVKEDQAANAGRAPGAVSAAPAE